VGALNRVFFAIAFIGASAFAQVRETTTVEVVEVPVYISANGAPVGGLTKDNFELFINGKRQTIDYFDVTDYATLNPEQSHDVRQRRLYMLVFDLLSPANALQRARKAALEFVDHASANETIGISTFDLAGLRVVVPFSRDHAAVERGIRELDLSNLSDPLHLAVGPNDRDPRVRMRDPLGDPNLLDPELTITEIAENEIAFLADLADRLAGMEGQKHVVLLSAGFSSAAIHGIRDSRNPGDIRNGPISSMADLNRSADGRGAPWANSWLIQQIEGLHGAYAAAGVFLDAIDIGGLRPFQSVLSNDSLYALVHDTGGRVIDRRNDLKVAMQVLTDLSRVVYTLGFRSVDTGRDENKIRVHLVNVPRGLQASYRRTYKSGGAQVDTGDMLRLADIIQNDISQNGVTTNVSAMPSAKGADVEVVLPGRELLAHTSGGFIGAKVMLYMMSGQGVVAFKIKRLDINVTKAEAGLNESPVRVRDTFELPPGNYAAKVVVRMDATGALGFGRADVSVP
jgi:VWFA-related protein